MALTSPSTHLDCVLKMIAWDIICDINLKYTCVISFKMCQSVQNSCMVSLSGLQSFYKIFVCTHHPCWILNNSNQQQSCFFRIKSLLTTFPFFFFLPLQLSFLPSLIQQLPPNWHSVYSNSVHASAFLNSGEIVWMKSIRQTGQELNSQLSTRTTEMWGVRQQGKQQLLYD